MAHHKEMLESYRSQRWDDARAALDRCREGRFPLTGLYDLYAQRIAEFKAEPPGADWDGVFVALSK